jgi:hypothetical protein
MLAVDPDYAKELELPFFTRGRGPKLPSWDYLDMWRAEEYPHKRVGILVYYNLEFWIILAGPFQRHLYAERLTGYDRGS